MSQYATVDELKAWMGNNVSSSNPGQYDQLTDRVNQKTAVDAVATSSLTLQSGVIDSYLAQAGITTPVSPIPDVLKQVCIDLTAFDMSIASGAREDVLVRFKAASEKAMGWLRDVAAGTVTIPGIDTGRNQTSSFVSDTSGAMINADNDGLY